MSIKTSLSGAPYFDTYDENKNFYKVLFQPGTSVQNRELHECQSILQKQIEKFGDSIFRKGSIVDGCNFIFYSNYAYAKLNDTTTDGLPTVPSTYEGLYCKNSANLIAYVVNTIDGFSGDANNFNTIYVNYVNAGNDYTQTAYSAGDVLTFYSPENKIFNVTVDNGSSAFSNTDQVVFVPRLEISQDSGTFSNGDYLYQISSGSNAQIVNISTNNVTNNKILTIKPNIGDLTNSSINAAAWTFDLFSSVRNDGNTATGTVKYIYGAGATAGIKTNATGRVTEVAVTNNGKNYSLLPYTTIKSSNNSSGINSLTLTPQNWYRTVKVASGGDAVGNGYAFGVTAGTIYQKGYFLKVSPQIVIVSKYTNTPNNVSVGFDTLEEIITSDIDPSLLDNAYITENENAPGADRLKLTPFLSVANTELAQANDQFLSLVSWNDGNPYKQNQFTIYSKIGDEMAKRTYEKSGNFVLDPFLVTTDCISNSSLEGTYFTVVADPGVAYVSGYRTESTTNYRIDVQKATKTAIANSQKISLNYGSYVRVKELGGVFQFSTGDTVDLYTTAKTFLSNTALVTSGNTTPQGTKIGTANIRSLVLESGLPGDANAIYRLYLFNVAMISGANFTSIQSVYYNGTTYKGIADVVLTLDPTTSKNIAKLNDVKNDRLLFNTGIESIKATANTTYIYRTIDQTTSVANNGTLTKSIAGTPNEFFPYSGTLSDASLKELYVVPVANDIIAYSSLTGTVNANTTTANLVGTSTTFISDIASGDYIQLYSNSISYEIKKVVTVVNNTLAILDSNCSVANTVSIYKRAFPKNAPIPFGSRAGLSANVNANGNILVLNFGMTFAGTTSTNTAIAYNVQRTNVTSTTKTANRVKYVKLCLSNNAANTVGPWCLGVPDIFRLRNVYVGNSSVSNSSIKVGTEFYIDHNQSSDYMDLSYLYVKPKSSLSLSSTDYLLVEFDYFTSSGSGYYDTVSYLGTSNAAQIATIDSYPLSNLSSVACSWEIPELFNYNGEYYNLNNTLDFRPYVSNTVAPSTNSSAAPLNPTYTLSFGNTSNSANDKKFPLPDTIFNSDIEQYMGRTDNVIMGDDGNIIVLRGQESTDKTKRFEPNLPTGTMKLQTITVPPYPNIARNLSNNMVEILSMGIANEVAALKNIKDHTVVPRFTANNISVNQPMRFTEADLGKLERRVSDLEYYQRLSLLETSITNKVIPSSIDATINRFKYGFFVDDFSTNLYTDTENPSYNAGIEPLEVSNYSANSSLPQLATNLCIPATFRWSVKHAAPVICGQFVDELIVSQSNATDPESLCTVTKDVNVVTGGQGIEFYFNLSGTSTVAQSNWSRYGLPVAVQKVKMSSVKSGYITMYTYAFADPAYSVYQNNTKVLSSANATNYTSADWDFLNSNKYTKDFFYAANYQHLGLLRGDVVYTGNEGIYGAGKIVGYHNHNLGTDYTIVVEGGNPDKLHPCQYVMFYPADTASQGVILTDVCGEVIPTVYSGTLSFPNLNADPYTLSRLQIECTGLRPNSIHNLYLDGTIDITHVTQEGKSFGDPLITDASGKIKLTYHFSESWTKKVNLAGGSLRNFNNIAYDALSWTWNGVGSSTADITYNYVSSYVLFELAAANSSAWSKIPIFGYDRITI